MISKEELLFVSHFLGILTDIKVHHIGLKDVEISFIFSMQDKSRSIEN